MSMLIINKYSCIATVDIVGQLRPSEDNITTHQKIEGLILSHIAKQKLLERHNFKKAAYLLVEDLDKKAGFGNFVIVFNFKLLVSSHVEVRIEFNSFLFFIESEQFDEPKHEIRELINWFSVHCVLVISGIKDWSDHQEKLWFYYDCCTVF